MYAIIDQKHLPANINQAVAKISLLTDGQIKPKFLVYLLNNKKFNKNLLGEAVESARLNLSLGDIKNLLVIIPPLTLQQTYSDRVQQIEALKQAMTASLRELEHNFQALMQEAFGG